MYFVCLLTVSYCVSIAIDRPKWNETHKLNEEVVGATKIIHQQTTLMLNGIHHITSTLAFWSAEKEQPHCFALVIKKSLKRFFFCVLFIQLPIKKRKYSNICLVHMSLKTRTKRRTYGYVFFPLVRIYSVSNGIEVSNWDDGMCWCCRCRCYLSLLFVYVGEQKKTCFLLVSIKWYAWISYFKNIFSHSISFDRTSIIFRWIHLISFYCFSSFWSWQLSLKNHTHICVYIIHIRNSVSILVNGIHAIYFW